MSVTGQSFLLTIKLFTKVEPLAGSGNLVLLFALKLIHYESIVFDIQEYFRLSLNSFMLSNYRLTMFDSLKIS